MFRLVVDIHLWDIGSRSHAKTSATCSLQHPENERQLGINSARTSISRNQGIAWIFPSITVLLTTLLGKNTIYRRWNTDTKLLDIANCSTSKSTLLVAENAILIRYYWHSANSTALYESIDGPAGRPADNPPNSDGLAVFHGTVPEWAVQVYWWPGPPIWQQFSLDRDQDPKWRSGTVANTTQRHSGLLWLVNTTIKSMLVYLWSFSAFQFWVCAVFPSGLDLGFPGLFGFLDYLSWDLGLDFRMCFAGFWVAFGLSHGVVCLAGFKLDRWLFPTNGVIHLLTLTLTATTLTDALWQQLSGSGHSDRSPLAAALRQQLWQQPDNCSDNDSPKSLPWPCSVNQKSSSFCNAKSLLVTALQAYRLASTLQSRRQ